MSFEWIKMIFNEIYKDKEYIYEVYGDERDGGGGWGEQSGKIDFN